MKHQFAAGAFFAVVGAAIGYLLATEYLRLQVGSFVGYDYLLRNVFRLQVASWDAFVISATIIGVCTGAGGLFGGHFAAEALTKAGTSSWQTIREMRRNKLIDGPGAGFVLAKTTRPNRPGKYIGSDAYPNCLVIAPTGAGKGVGFVYPNLLTFKGSTVTLDIKGENFQTTARQREAMGDKVYKFAPVAFGEPSHRYNPLERIGKLGSYSEITYELRKIAGLFLQADRAGEWLQGAIQLFVAAGAVAYERGTFTLGGIHRVLSEGDGDIRAHLTALAKVAREPALQLELNALAKLDQKTLSAYTSVMSNAGFDLWSNPHIAEMTSRSDFSFETLRRERASIFFQVPDTDLETIAGLVRLFFNELVGTIQSSMPGEHEPHHVMIILDEFHRLGKMEKVADAMSTIRGFNGRIAIITQLLPRLDAIYGYEGRLSIQGNAPLKLYLTPAEEMTVKDVSEACGMTTKRTITKSRATGIGERATVTERNDERPLLTEDDARRLDEDRAIVIVKGKQPVMAWRIKHYEDSTFKRILEDQEERGWASIDNKLLASRVAHLEAAQSVTPAGPQIGIKEPSIAQLSADQIAAFRDASANILGKPRDELTTEDMAELDRIFDVIVRLIDAAAALPKQNTASDRAPQTSSEGVSITSPTAGAGPSQSEVPEQPPKAERPARQARRSRRSQLSVDEEIETALTEGQTPVSEEVTAAE